MNDRRYRFFAWLDRLAEWTGMPALAEQRQRRRRMRWLPLAVLGMASVGLAFSLTHAGRDFWIGYALVFVASQIAIIAPTWGPLRSVFEQSDEFERAQRQAAMLVGLVAAVAAGMAGMLITAMLIVFDIWPAEVAALKLIVFAFYILTLISAVPTLYASWRTRPIPDED